MNHTLMCLRYNIGLQNMHIFVVNDIPFNDCNVTLKLNHGCDIRLIGSPTMECSLFTQLVPCVLHS